MKTADEQARENRERNRAWARTATDMQLADALVGIADGESDRNAIVIDEAARRIRERA